MKKNILLAGTFTLLFSGLFFAQEQKVESTRVNTLPTTDKHKTEEVKTTTGITKSIQPKEANGEVKNSADIQLESTQPKTRKNKSEIIRKSSSITKEE